MSPTLIFAFTITLAVSGAVWLYRSSSRVARTLQAEPGHSASHQAEAPVAIIGLSFKVPDAETLERLWDNLSTGKDSLRTIPEARWDKAMPAGIPAQAGLIEGIGEFDPMFFGISAAEAEVMDPQQRLMMLHIWRAIEDAGYAPESLSGRDVGIFMATAPNGYRSRMMAAVEPEGHHATAGVASVGPNRMSYFLNLRGPSETVETACSSSLVAMDRGVAAIRSGKCELVLCGGVNTLLDPDLHISFARAGMLSPNSRCQTFAATADGYARGEGVIVFALKDLQQALRDRDHIYGQILASDVNHGGRANTFTSPNPQAQASLIRSVLDKAGISPASVGYIEAHGTGTKLGDPIEVSALKNVFRQALNLPEAYCALGSIKTNIGHLELAAGAAGVLKVLAQFRYRAIAPSLHSQPQNPMLRLDGSPFYIATCCQPWQPLQDSSGVPLPLRAGVSSFGFGGVNAHVLLEEPPVMPESDQAITALQPLLVPLSAKSEAVLAAIVERLRDWLRGRQLNAEQMRQLAYTLQIGRNQMAVRWGAVVSSQTELEAALQAYPHVTPQSGGAGQGAWLQPWLAGETLDWQQWYSDADRPWKLSLPSYPFELTSYWLNVSQASGKLPEPTSDSLVLVPHWQAVELVRQGAPRHHDSRTHVILAGPKDRERAEALAQLLPVMVIAVADGSTGADQAEAWLQAAAELFELLRARCSSLLQVLVLEQRLPSALEGVSGLLRSLVREQGGIQQLITVDASLKPARIIELMELEAGYGQDDHVRYQDGQRFRQQWREEKTEPGEASACLKAGGVYLISGGLGGIGRQLARWISTTTPNTTLILLGRRDLAVEDQQLLQSLSGNGCQVVYRALDVSSAVQVGALFQDIGIRYKRLDGIFHCAGQMQDAPASTKSLADFKSVLAGKVAGLVLLDTLSRPLEPSFIVNFGSAAGVLGNAGQTDYAYANAITDYYVQARARELNNQAGAGRLLSIDWPVWTDGNLRPRGDKVVLLERLGLLNLDSVEAFRQLAALLHATAPQALVATRRSEALLALLNGAAAQTVAEESAPVSPAGGEELLEFLRKVVAEVTRFPLTEVSDDRPFAEFGIDSIMVTSLNTRLEAEFGPLPKTLFFEYRTLTELAGFLQKKPRFAVRLGITSGSGEVVTATSQEKLTEVDDGALRAAASADDGIAIIGVAGRYPGAGNLDAFWELLAEGRSAIQEIPEERWPLQSFYEADMETAVATGRSYSKWGGFIDGFADFDPQFFALSPKEAKLMDPQERLFLQTAWDALEDAGYTRDRIRQQHRNQVGVYAGVTKTGYELNRADTSLATLQDDPVSSFSSVANRVSYFFDFNGPSHAVDTMCSSSLTAIHQACEDLRRGHCQLALAGGVNLYLHPQTYVRLSARRMLSSDGACKSFGAGGNGFVPGEGVGVVVLKPLASALRDGDNIQGVIRATAVNHGGRTNGYTVPNPVAQADVIKSALSRGGIEPETVSYIEAHGTGTELGDPIEIRGITKAFKELSSGRARTTPCAVGSVKTNIGHLEAAAGIAGVTKVLLQMKHRRLVPSLYSSVLNPAIDFSGGQLQVPQILTDWSTEGRYVAGISSFGAGGTNAHVILEAFERPFRRRLPSDERRIFVLSTRSREQLVVAAERLLSAIRDLQVRSEDLDRLAYTLQMGREAFNWRLAVVESDIGQLAEKLAAFIAQSVADAEPAVAGLYCRAVEPEPAALAGESLEDVARAWVTGLNIDWQRFYPGPVRPSLMSLPTYPFQLRRLWIGVGETRAAAFKAPVQSLFEVAKPIVVAALPEPHAYVPQDTSTAEESRYSLQLSVLQLCGSRTAAEGTDYAPLAVYLELILATFAQRSQPLALQQLLAAPGVVGAAGVSLHAALITAADIDNSLGVEVYDDDSVVLCQALSCRKPILPQLSEETETAWQQLAGPELYARLRERDVRHEPVQQYVEELRWNGQGMVEILLAKPARAQAGTQTLPPAYLTALLQALLALKLQGAQPWLRAIDSLQVVQPGVAVRRLHLIFLKTEASAQADVVMVDAAERVVAQFSGLGLEEMGGLLSVLGQASVKSSLRQVPVKEAGQPKQAVQGNLKPPIASSGKIILMPVDAPWLVSRPVEGKVQLAAQANAAPIPEQAKNRVLRERDVLEDLKSAFGTSLLIPTLNRTGYMLEEMTFYSQEFAQFAGRCEAEVLDLGCAFGVATIAALEQGARVVAVDMEKSHLEILQERVVPAVAERLRTQVGILPDVDFPPESFDAIHAARVLHFLRPADVRLVLAKMFEWLRPGGKIFVTSDSPYFGYWASRADDYLRRKASGDPWPAFIEDVTKVFDKKDTAGAPSLINPMDPDVLQRECERLGYQVKTVGFCDAGTFSQMHENRDLVGKEHAGVIARKPETVPSTRDYRTRASRQRLQRVGLGQLDYYSLGQGETAMILVHGLGCDHTFWSEQALQFASAYRVLVVDLPCHGDNQQGESEFTVAGCAQLVKALADELQLTDCILIGHSLGGPIVLSAAALMPERMRAVVGVETLHDLSEQGREAIGRALLMSEKRKEALLESMLPVTDSKGVRQRVLYARMKVSDSVLAQGDREMVAYVRGLNGRVPCPALLVNASGWIPTNIAAAEALGLQVAFIDSREHYLMLDKPYRLNRVIEEFLAGV